MESSLFALAWSCESLSASPVGGGGMQLRRARMGPAVGAGGEFRLLCSRSRVAAGHEAVAGYFLDRRTARPGERDALAVGAGCLPGPGRIVRSNHADGPGAHRGSFAG